MPCAVPFFIELMDGEEKLIARIGALTVVARCDLDFPNPDGSQPPAFDFVHIDATSSIDGWFVTLPAGDGGGGSPEILASGEATLASVLFSPTGQSNKYVSPRFSRPSAVAPDGSFVTLAADNVGLGIRIFGKDCILTGMLFRYKVNLE